MPVYTHEFVLYQKLMRARFAMSVFNRSLAAMLAIGLALLAWAHDPYAHRESFPAGVDLAAYTLPDGTLPELCLVSEDGEQKGSEAHCPVCVLGKTFAPVHQFIPLSRVDYHFAHLDPVDEQLPVLVSRRRANTPRGPPSAAEA
jgi:hypothetical protein